MRKIVSYVLFVLSVLCLAFALVSSIVMAVQDWPCMSHPPTSFDDGVMLVLLIGTALALLGMFLVPRPKRGDPL